MGLGIWTTSVATLAPAEQWCTRHGAYGHHDGACPASPGAAPHDGCDHAGDLCAGVGSWAMHDNWLAHDTDGKPADGFRWARLVTDDGEPYFHYAGRSFVLADAATVLATLMAGGDAAPE